MRSGWCPLVLLAALPAFASPSPSYGFGGFASSGGRYWKQGATDLVCDPSGCMPSNRQDLRAQGFVKPPRSRTLGGEPIGVAVEDDALVVRLGERRLAGPRPEGRVVSANSNVFVSPDGDRIAVEYEFEGKGGKSRDVAVFQVLGSASSPAPATAPARPHEGRSALDRVTAKGGVWEQRIVPCDQAGVLLELKKNRKFAIAITTRCQGDKSATKLDGLWSTDGEDRLTLAFENPGGPTETMACQIGECADGSGEECLVCRQEDVAFTLHVVRR